MNTQRVFACGVDPLLFKRKYEALSEDNQACLERVARRVQLTLKLRYEMGFVDRPFAPTNERYILRDLELSSIEVYLLCTCLDTLAGKPTYKGFAKWITEQPDANQLGPHDVAKLYSRYEQEYGVGKNLGTLFANLPATAKAWLAHNVAVRRSGHPLAPGSEGVDKLVERLYRYFYHVRRNRFTHGSVSVHTPIAEDVRQAADGGWWITPVSGADFVLYPDRPSQKWDLSHREGLDEATILRMIIYAAGLQRLQIDLTSALVETNLSRLSRIDALHAFVSEVARNSALVKSWRQLDHRAMGEPRSYLFHVGVMQLSCRAARRMIERYLDNTFESGLRGMTREYVREVDQVNSQITEFNEANPPRAEGQHAHVRCRLISEFLEGLVETPPCKSVARWPSMTEMTNLWLVIRDPCYT